jgi:RHS repeat-associated protein
MRSNHFIVTSLSSAFELLLTPCSVARRNTASLSGSAWLCALLCIVVSLLLPAKQASAQASGFWVTKSCTINGTSYTGYWATTEEGGQACITVLAGSGFVPAAILLSCNPPGAPTSGGQPLCYWGTSDNSGPGGQFYLFAQGATVFYYVSNDPRRLADCKTCNRQTDPITPATGNVSLQEVDIPMQSQSPQSAFKRYYNSADPGVTDLGIGWRHSFSRSVVAYSQNTPYQQYKHDDYFYVPGNQANGYYYARDSAPPAISPSDACTSGWATISANSPWPTATASYSGTGCALNVSGTVVATIPVFSAFPIQPTTQNLAVAFDAVRDDGQIVNFTLSGSSYVSQPGSSLRLSASGSGYQLIDDDDNVEIYNSTGQLVSVTTRGGVVETMGYDTSNRLHTVTDSFAHQLTLAYNSSSQLTSVQDPAGNFVQYAADTSGRLQTVTNLDLTVRTYAYEDPVYINQLTGVVDESSARYSTWAYDWLGRGRLGYQGSASLGANNTSFTYNSNNIGAGTGNGGNVTTVDALGESRTFTFSQLGMQSRVTSISGYQCPTCAEPAATTYDSAGWVASRTDYNGNLTCYANDSARGLELFRVEGFAPGSVCPSNLSTYVPQSGTSQRKISTLWSPIWREPSQITEVNRTTVYTFDASGNIHQKEVIDTTVAPNVTRTWTNTYNSFGQVLTAQLPRTDLNSTTTYVYYPCPGTYCGQVHTLKNALGQIATFNTYDAYGRPLTITDPNGALTTLVYDARERLTSSAVTEGAFSETTRFSYYPTGQLETVTQPDASTVTYNYDQAHRLTDITDGAGNYIAYTLDAAGNRQVTEQIDPTSALDYKQTQIYNTLNQLYQVIGAAGPNNGVTTTFGYDNNGNTTSIDAPAAPLARNTEQQFDALNRLIKITDPNNGVAKFSYDAEDDLTQVTDPRSFLSKYTFNGFSQVLTTQLPSFGPTLLTNTYDSFGNLATYTDARTAIATYTYDALNRPLSAVFSRSGVTDQTIHYTYDSGTNGKGHLTGASDAHHSLSWGYDAKGRVISKSQTVASVAKTVNYGYANGDLVTLTTPSGQTITYTYSDHLITSIAVNSTTLLSSAIYEPFGPIRGWNWGNGTTETRLYDTDGNPSQIGGPELHTYSIDNAFRIQGISNAANSNLSWTYGYDVLDRVTSGSETGTNQVFTYDADGNRKTQTGTINGTYTVSATTNRLTSITGTPARTYSFDSDGDDLTYSNITLVFNDRDRMANATVASVQTTYTYNAVGQRIEKSGGPAGTVIFVYDEAGHLEGEYTSSGALIQETVWLGDTPVATLQPVTGGVGIYYIHADHLNAPQIITRATDNAIMWRWDRDSFGSISPTVSGSFSYNPRFPGQYYDLETGLFYDYFRDYDPQTGRFIESDPIGLYGGSYSTYAYAWDDPIDLSDPFGLRPPPSALELALERAGVIEAVGGGPLDVAADALAVATIALAAIPSEPNSRTIPKPPRPSCGCTCTCRADRNDNIIHNPLPGEKTFAFGTATASSCAEASKLAKRAATKALGRQPKHVGCKCTE